MLQRAHSRDTINHSCRSGKHCTTLGDDATAAAPIQHQQELILSAPGDLKPSRSDQDRGAATDSTQCSRGIPRPPTPALPAQFECPICFEVKEFLKPSDCKKHVISDVQPFTCTVRGCSESEPRAFKRQANWLRHELVRYRQPEYWDCLFAGCSFTSGSKDIFVGHLRREHGLPWRKAKEENHRKRLDADLTAENAETLREVMNKCQRKTLAQEQCDFCGERLEGWKKLMPHLARHIVDLAMPVLGMVRRRTATYSM